MSEGPPDPDRWAEDLALALEAVRSAGEVVMEPFRTEMEVRHKGPDQPVTDADLEADARLREVLTGARPDYGWLSEETADRPDRLDRERLWIVDPIDGTRSYVAGYREFAISIGLVEHGAPVAGVIYNPAQDHVVWATAGGGAWGRAGGPAAEAVPLDARTEAGGDVLLASRSERGSGEFEPFEEGWTIEEVGSTAWKLAGTALGRGSYISRGPKSEWDVAAGVLVVEEAGGVVTDVDGRVIGFNRRDPYVHGVVAGPPDAHWRLLERARTLPAPRLSRQQWDGDEGGR